MLLIAVGGGLALVLVACTLEAWLQGRRPFVAAGVDPASQPLRGAGGDPRLLETLREDGIDLASIGRYPVGELRAALERTAPELASEVVILRGRVLNNLTRRGVPGFVVTPHSSPVGAGSVLRSAAGDELVSAITDRAGRYTQVGLPRDIELTNVLRRSGFLQLAYTTRTSFPGDYLQDDVGTIPAGVARPAYAGDPAHPFAADGAVAHALGEIALTVVHERSTPDADGFGLIGSGKYEGNGVAGVSFRLWRVPEPESAGALSSPAATPAPALIVYADVVAGVLERRWGPWTRWPVRALSRLGLRRLLTLLELPAPDRTDTSALGLALVRSLPAGRYEVEARHPTLECTPTRDAWRGSDPRRAPVEVVAGTMGDVRFYCRQTARAGS